MAFVESFFEIAEAFSRLTVLAGVFLAYIVCLVIYRLYLSPIAKFPGPKFTAVSKWCQFYHDVIRGGQFPFVIQKWHAQYGPIIRINPTEIHIADPDFYEVIYSQTRVRKEESFRHRFGMPGSIHSTPEKDLHFKRRAALSSYFSRRQVLEFNPYIQSCVNKLCHRLNKEYQGTFKVVKLDHAFATYTTDIITYYVFARSYDFLNYPEFVAPFTTAFEKFADASQICAHFPWLLSFMASLPKSVTAVVQPSMVPYLDFLDEMTTQIRKTIDSKNEASKDVKHEADENIKHRTVFDEILHSNLPPEELLVSRLQDEASVLVSAGLETTKMTLTIACFHILDNPDVYRQLCQELKKVFPDPIMQPALPELEKLPYLTAVIQESLRFSYGVAQRLPRILDSALQYGSHVIPPGVPVSMTHYIQHHDERIFPSSQTFEPDRWLGNPQAPHSSKPLTHYLVSFSKGTRSCLGMNLAYAELYIGLATLFRRVNMELFETQRDAVDMAMDQFTQSPKAGTKGVRVLIK